MWAVVVAFCVAAVFILYIFMRIAGGENVGGVSDVVRGKANKLPPEQEMSPERKAIRDALYEHILRINSTYKMTQAGSRERRRAAAEALEDVIADVERFCEENPIAEVTNIRETKRAAYLAKCRNAPLYTTTRDDTHFVCILDTETTGVGDDDEAISVAAMLVEVDKSLCSHVREVARYVGYREPSVPISEGAFRVHGLSMHELEGKSLDLETLYRIIDSADVLVAHNADFDCRMLSTIIHGIAERTWACSMNDLRWAWKEMTGGRKGLDYICSALGIQKAAKHDAMGDVEALYKVLQTRTGKTKRSRTLLHPLLKKAFKEYGEGA